MRNPMAKSTRATWSRAWPPATILNRGRRTSARGGFAEARNNSRAPPDLWPGRVGKQGLSETPVNHDENHKRDATHAVLLARMNAAIDKNQVPKAIGKARVRRAADLLKDHIGHRRAKRDGTRRRTKDT